jgi:leader peptidase (prepilin peptidase)/N-methyltransferase
MNVAHPHAVAAIVSGLFGLVIGSFVGVVADRVPREESVVKPPSHCTSCGAQLRVVDNIPVISYLVLRGKCHSCDVRIPPVDLYVELTTALLFVAFAWRLPTLWALPSYCVLAAGLVALSVIDFAHKRLPTPIVYLTAGSAGALLVLASWPSHRFGHLVGAAIGAGACFAVFLLIWFVAPKAMGFGDVRLAGLCGGALGWLGSGAVAVGMVGAFLFAGVPAVVMLILGKANRKTAIAFGPFLALATIVGVCFGETIAHAWLTI